MRRQPLRLPVGLQRAHPRQQVKENATTAAEVGRILIDVIPVKRAKAKLVKSTFDPFPELGPFRVGDFRLL
jgi:hypothetical protein